MVGFVDALQLDEAPQAVCFEQPVPGHLMGAETALPTYITGLGRPNAVRPDGETRGTPQRAGPLAIHAGPAFRRPRRE